MLRNPNMALLGLMPLLVAPDAKGAGGGLVRRDAWEDYYGSVVKNLGLGTPIVPLDVFQPTNPPATPLPATSPVA